MWDKHVHLDTWRARSRRGEARRDGTGGQTSPPHVIEKIGGREKWAREERSRGGERRKGEVEETEEEEEGWTRYDQLIASTCRRRRCFAEKTESIKRGCESCTCSFLYRKTSVNRKESVAPH